MWRGVVAAATAVVLFFVVIAPSSEAATVPQLVKDAGPSVVFIEAQGQTGRKWSATGFIVGDTGRIVTCYHVVEGAKAVSIKLPSGEALDPVRVYSYDRDADLAIIEVKGKTPSGLHIRSKPPVEPGEDIVVIGNPLGLQNTVTRGIVSAIRETQNVQYVQMSAAVSPGSSGAPILSMDGEVVGVVSATIDESHAQSLNFGVAARHIAALLVFA